MDAITGHAGRALLRRKRQERFLIIPLARKLKDNPIAVLVPENLTGLISVDEPCH